jgi:Sif protein
MSISVGHGFLKSTIDDATINNMQAQETPPHLSLWEKIKDFFFSTHQEKALKLLFELFHPKDTTTIQNVRKTCEKFKKLVSPGFQHLFVIKNSNLDPDNYTITNTTISIIIDEYKYTINNGVNTLYHYDIFKELSEKEKIAGIKILNYYKKFKYNLAKKENPNQEFTPMVYNGDKQEIKGRVYYLSKNHPPVYQPNTPIRHNNDEKGSFKHVTHKDERFVALAPNQLTEKFNPVNDCSHFQGLSSMKFGLAVTPELIIARNAGDDLFNYLSNNHCLSPLAFENAVNDLQKLHEKRVYLRDIKPENTAYDGRKVNFIDLDDRIGVHKETVSSIPSFDIYGEKVMCTPQYITLGLCSRIYTQKDGKQQLRKEDISQTLKVADEYAFLMTMIETTTNDTDLKSAIAIPKTDIMGIINQNEIQDKLDKLKGEYTNKKISIKYYESHKNTLNIERLKIEKEYINSGVMNSKNEKHFTSWIDKNIKPEHIKSVKLLLTNPARYAEKPNIHLAEMLLFKDEAVDARCD